MLDPKTTSVAHKYRDDAHILPSLAYYQPSQQLIAPQLNKTFVTVWNADAQEAELKISLSEGMTVLQVSQDGHYLFGGSSTGTPLVMQAICTSGRCLEAFCSRRKLSTLRKSGS